VLYAVVAARADLYGQSTQKSHSSLLRQCQRRCNPGLICALYTALEAPLFHGDARMLVKSQARVTKEMVQVTLPIQARTGFWAEKINPNPP